MKRFLGAMKSPKSNKNKLLALILIVVAVVLLGIVIYAAMTKKSSNLAEDALAPLSKTLVNKGATKLCSSGDSGKGPDNENPWTSALYEVSGNREEAIKLVHDASSEAGYALQDGPYPSNPEDNKFYSDKSKASSYKELKDGTIDLKVEVYGNKSYSGDAVFCTVKDGKAEGKTVVNVTLALPDRK